MGWIFATRVNATLARWFYWLGTKAVKRPKVFLLISFLVILLSAGGFPLLKFQFDGFYLWAPLSSPGFKNGEKLFETYGYFPRRNALLYSSPTNSSILTKQLLVDLYWVQQNVSALHLSDSDGVVTTTWRNECYRYYAGGPCQHHSLLAAWDYDINVIERLTDQEVRETISSRLDLAHLLGHSRHDDTVTSVGEYFYLKPDLAISGALELKFIDYIREEKTDMDWVTVHYLAGRSIDDEVQRVVTGDSLLVGISIGLIVIFMALVLGKRNLVESKLLLGLSAGATVTFSLLGGVGLSGYVQSEFTTITPLLIFVVCGIGVDDMIIISDTFSSLMHLQDVKERLPMGLALAGPSITLTTLTDIAAFAMGSVVDMPAVRYFCATACLSLLILFLLQVTFFSVMLMYDYKRIQASRMDLFPCVVLGNNSYRTGSSPCKDHASPPPVLDAQTVTVKSEDSTTEPIDLEAIPKHQQFQQHRKSFTARLLGDYYAKFISKKPVAAIVILVFVAWSGIQCWFATNLLIGLPLSAVLPYGSYASSYLDTAGEAFGASTSVLFVVIGDDFEWGDRANKPRIDALIQHLYASNSTKPSSLHSWYYDFNKWLEVQGRAQDLTPQNFPVEIKRFLAENRIFENDIVFDEDGNVHSARFSMVQSWSDDLQEAITAMKDVRQAYVNTGFEGDSYPVATWHAFSDRDDVIFSIVLQNVIMAGATVLVILVFFIHPAMALIVGLCVGMIDMCVFGWMYLLSIPLDAVSFIVIAMAVGLSVDYCAHIAIAYCNAKLTCDHVPHNAPSSFFIKYALEEIGASIVSGGFSTMLGVLVLAFASSEAFRIFFELIFAIVLFGLLHGLVFLPAVLAILPTNFVHWILSERTQSADANRVVPISTP